MRISIVERIFTPKKAPEGIIKPIEQVIKRLETKGLQEDARYEWHPKNAKSQTKFDTFIDTREGIHIKPTVMADGKLKITGVQVANGNEAMTIDLSSGKITNFIKRPFFSTASGFLARMQKVVDKMSLQVQ